MDVASMRLVVFQFAIPLSLIPEPSSIWLISRTLRTDVTVHSRYDAARVVSEAVGRHELCYVHEQLVWYPIQPYSCAGNLHFFFFLSQLASQKKCPFLTFVLHCEP